MTAPLSQLRDETDKALVVLTGKDVSLTTCVTAHSGKGSKPASSRGTAK